MTGEQRSHKGDERERVSHAESLTDIARADAVRSVSRLRLGSVRRGSRCSAYAQMSSYLVYSSLLSVS